MPGRFFFIWIGVNQTSSAPAASDSLHGRAENLGRAIVEIRFEAR